MGKVSKIVKPTKTNDCKMKFFHLIILVLVKINIKEAMITGIVYVVMETIKNMCIRKKTLSLLVNLL